MSIFDRFPSQGPIPEEAHLLIARSMEDLRIKTAAHDSTWHLGDSAWAVDQNAGTIVFTTPQGITATSAVQIIGTYNTADGTWLWGWDHPSVHPPLQQDAHKLKAFGEEHSLIPLTTRKLSCTEDEAWEFAALACILCDAQGAYRGPAGPTRVFMTFRVVQLRKSPGAVDTPTSPNPGPTRSSPPPLPSESTPISVGSGSPAALVLEFIRAYFAWNAAAIQRQKTATHPPDATDIAVTEYDRLIARFYAASVAPRDPPMAIFRCMIPSGKRSSRSPLRTPKPWSTRNKSKLSSRPSPITNIISSSNPENGASLPCWSCSTTEKCL